MYVMASNLFTVLMKLVVGYLCFMYPPLNILREAPTFWFLDNKSLLVSLLLKRMKWRQKNLFTFHISASRRLSPVAPPFTTGGTSYALLSGG
jgi:hypothetical protein